MKIFSGKKEEDNWERISDERHPLKTAVVLPYYGNHWERHMIALRDIAQNPKNGDDHWVMEYAMHSDDITEAINLHNATTKEYRIIP